MDKLNVTFVIQGELLTQFREYKEEHVQLGLTDAQAARALLGIGLNHYNHPTGRTPGLPPRKAGVK